MIGEPARSPIKVSSSHHFANHGHRSNPLKSRQGFAPCMVNISFGCGSMFSGKTEKLIRRLKRAQFAKQKVEIFKPAIDTRYDEEWSFRTTKTKFALLLFLRRPILLF